MTGDGGWTPVGPPTRRECPLCDDWFMVEPPAETLTEWTPGGNLTARIRQHSAIPHVLVHILTAHPNSEQAKLIRAECGIRTWQGDYVDLKRVADAVESETRDQLRAHLTRHREAWTRASTEGAHW